ncbi:MAG: ABC transporter substrate-binding protein, partial [Hyphomicrobiales bacterium]|nr:ABC transporter substrate-binding protein [Hyphomicrobiales bacterium]
GACRDLAADVAAITDGKFTIDVHEAGELAPALGALDAASTGGAEIAHVALHYFWDKRPELALAASTPFGMNPRQLAAWFEAGGGRELVDAALADAKLRALPAGNTGAQMGGWFRKPVLSIDDLKGAKIRVGGFAGKMFEKVGAVPTATARGQALDALKSGALDALDWVSPVDDERFDASPAGAGRAISSVAPHYAYPAPWKNGLQLHFLVSTEKYDALPKPFQAALTAAAARAARAVEARYDAANPFALKRLVVAGARVFLFPPDVAAAFARAAQGIYDDLSSQDPKFAAIAKPYLAFRDAETLWWQVSQYPYDNYMVRERGLKS